MVRSTEEPQTIKLKREQKASNGLMLDLLVRWEINQITVDDEDEESHQEWEYEEEQVSMPYNGDRSQISNFLANHEKEILLKAKARQDSLEEADKDQLSYPNFRADSTYYGQVASVDTGRADKKYIQVEKSVGDRTITAWCYVTYSMLLAHQNNDLAHGDYVIISFADEDLDKPVVVDKVVGF